MAAAMAELRLTLGEDAVLLDTREVGGMVEVTAAIPAQEDEPWEVLPDAPATLPFAPLPAAPLLLIGQPGAGKTTTALKLAARHKSAGTAPLVITTDAARIDPLAAGMRALALGFVVAANATALRKALARASAAQPVIIDSPACNPFDQKQARALLPLIGQAVPVLVQPAGLCAEEAREEALAFHAMGVRHLLVTRADVARRGASVLAAARAGLALTEAATAEGLQPLNAAWLAARWRDVSWT
jgi:flagellar biosynthesis protein FlhF